MRGLEADLEILRLVLETVAIAGRAATRASIFAIPAWCAPSSNADPRGRRARPSRHHACCATKTSPACWSWGAVRTARGDRPSRRCARSPGACTAGPACSGQRPRRPAAAAGRGARRWTRLEALLPGAARMRVSIDLADVGGYGYHSGVTFALYAEGWHDALVRGGRYDDVSRAFGRARPATGFSLDLRKLARRPAAGGTGPRRARALGTGRRAGGRRCAACAGPAKSSCRSCPATSTTRTNSSATAS